MEVMGGATWKRVRGLVGVEGRVASCPFGAEVEYEDIEGKREREERQTKEIASR